MLAIILSWYEMTYEPIGFLCYDIGPWWFDASILEEVKDFIRFS